MEIPVKLKEFEKKIPFWNLIVLLLIIGYAFINIQDIFLTDTYPDYELNVVQILNGCNHDELFKLRGFVQWELVCFSKELGNEKLLPFVSSLIILGLTYLLSKKYTGSYLLGITSLIIVMSSGNFYLFDSSSTYPQFWAMFFLLSIYLIHSNKLYFLAPIVYFLSILSKELAFLFIPIIIISILDSKLNKNKKLILFISISLIIGIALIRFLFSGDSFTGTNLVYNQDKLFFGLFKWFFLLDASLIIALSIPIILIQLGKRLRKKEYYTKSIFSSIIIMIMLVPLIEGLTDNLNHAYRMIPFVVIASIGISMTISNSIDYLTKHTRKFNFISNKEKEN